MALHLLRGSFYVPVPSSTRTPQAPGKPLPFWRAHVCSAPQGTYSKSLAIPLKAHCTAVLRAHLRHPPKPLSAAPGPAPAAGSQHPASAGGRAQPLLIHHLPGCGCWYPAEPADEVQAGRTHQGWPQGMFSNKSSHSPACCLHTSVAPCGLRQVSPSALTL